MRSSRKPCSRNVVRITPEANPTSSKAANATPARMIRAAKLTPFIRSTSTPPSWATPTHALISQKSNGSRKSSCCAAPPTIAKINSEKENNPSTKTRRRLIAKSGGASTASASTTSATAAPLLRTRTSSRSASACGNPTKLSFASSPSPPPVSNLTSARPIMRASGFCSTLTS